MQPNGFYKRFGFAITLIDVSSNHTMQKMPFTFVHLSLNTQHKECYVFIIQYLRYYVSNDSDR